MIERTASSILKKYIDGSKSPHNVILVGGARQVGKSTLIENMLSAYENVIKVNLEKNKILKDKIDQTNSFEDFQLLLTTNLGLDISKEQILFIDEAQESEKLGSYVRFLKEDCRNTKSILSGSSMNRIFRNSRVPVGRVVNFTLPPLSFYEFLGTKHHLALQNYIAEQGTSKKINISALLHQELLKAFDEYLQVGGLPEVVTSYYAQENFKIIRDSIYYNQEEDFVRKELFQKKYLFKKALSGVANHLGLASKYTHISDSHQESKSICTILSAWNLILEIPQHGIASTSSFYPKRYLYDIGIAQDLRNMPFPDLSILETKNIDLRSQLGGLFENVVLLSLMEELLQYNDISGWKKNSDEAVEVDFIWRDRKKILPLECKACLKVTPRVFSSLRSYLRQTEQKFGMLISAAPFQVFKEDAVTLVNLPIYLCKGSYIKNIFSNLG